MTVPAPDARLLSNADRRIVDVLGQQPNGMRITDLAIAVEYSAAHVSDRLRVLASRGVVELADRTAKTPAKPGVVQPSLGWKSKRWRLTSPSG